MSNLGVCSNGCNYRELNSVETCMSHKFVATCETMKLRRNSASAKAEEA